MPPKKAPATTSGSTEAHMEALITVIAASDIKIDTNVLAPILGIAAAKNVPRKLNSIVSPYGYEFKGGSFVRKGSAGNANVIKAEDDEEDTKAEVKPKVAGKSTGATKTTKNKPAAKKRKLEDSDEDGDEVKKEESESEAEGSA